MTVTSTKSRSATPVSATVRETKPAKWARRVFATLFLAGSASHVLFALGMREIYRDFADWSPFGWVRDAWASVFMPNALVFGLLLALFEVTTGAFILAGGRRMQLGLLGVIGFHVGLMFFGLWAWSVPMIGAFVWLIRSDRRRARSAQMVRG